MIISIELISKSEQKGSGNEVDKPDIYLYLLLQQLAIFVKNNIFNERDKMQS